MNLKYWLMLFALGVACWDGFVVRAAVRGIIGDFKKKYQKTVQSSESIDDKGDDKR